LAKLGVSLGLVSYLIWLVDWERAVSAINKAVKFPLLAAPLLLFTGFGFASFRWQLILAENKVAFSYWKAFSGYLLGTFYSIFLPGVIGGDTIRIGRCVQQSTCQIGVAAASVLLERISGIFALLSIALLVYLIFPVILSTLLAVQATSSVTVVATIGMIVLTVALLGRRTWLGWLPQEGASVVWTFVRSGMQTLATLRARTLGLVLILSALFQTMDIVATSLLSQAIGLAVPLTVFFAVIPLVYLATVLPISLGGLGVREGTLVFLLAQFGVATSDAVTLSFLVYLNRVVIGSLGGLLQLVETFSSRKPDRVVKDVNHV